MAGAGPGAKMAAERMKAINSGNGKVLASNLELADGFWRRLRGLLGRSSFPRDAGLLLKPCRSVHTFGMRFPIDLVFLGSAGQVIALCKEVPPNRLPPAYPGTCSVLELPVGKITETATRTGDLIVIEAQETEQTNLPEQRLRSKDWSMSQGKSMSQRESSEVCETNRLWEIAANILVAFCFFLFAWSFAKAFVATPRASILLVVIKETLDAVDPLRLLMILLGCRGAEGIPTCTRGQLRPLMDTRYAQTQPTPTP